MATSLKQDLIRLGKLKRLSSDANRRAKDAGKDFKDVQRRVLDRMRSDDVESMKTGGTLYSPTTTIYATIEDRSEFVRWALENSEPLDLFLGHVAEQTGANVEALRDTLIAAINETSFIQIKEHSDPLNALVRACLDDGQILPPGTGFRTDEYISQRKS